MRRLPLPAAALAALLCGIIPGRARADVLTSASVTSQTVALGAVSALSSTWSIPSATLPPSVFTWPKQSSSPWKTHIVGTVFWIGEPAGGGNSTPNVGSSWDPNWMYTYGGYDDPTARGRDGFRPSRFTPKQNPFYVALPYNDCWNSTATKAEAARLIPWFKDAFRKSGHSVCRDRWIAIRSGKRTCYAQWSDCGPFVTTDASYVFGDAKPANSANGGAGIDISPSVRDYLQFWSGSHCDWRFVEAEEVPEGPWKAFGKNNPFSKDYQPQPDPAPTAAQFAALRESNPAGPSALPQTLVKGSISLPGLRLKLKSRE